MTATKQRDQYHQLLKDLAYHLASLEIHRAHAHMPPGPVPDVITATNCAIETTMDALEGVITFTRNQATLAAGMLATFTADPPVATEVLASTPTDSSSAAS